VVTWAAGPRTIREVIQPARQSRPDFRIVAGMPVCVTDDEAEARAHIDRLLGANDRFPSYRKVLSREGVDGVAGIAIVGSEADVHERLDEFAASGATDFAAHVMAPDRRAAERTWEVLAARAAGG
jgi:alkanesulfonate monooxygenase SsuD/methylene tetrahydromethanopterin reductase-like flavin-dependent oxidoreductase (luciferase family)